MESNKKLFCIKLAHTIIWFFYVCVIFYVLYAAAMNKIDKYLYISVMLVIFEGIVLAIFKGKCPLTIMAYKYSEDHDVGFDIFLPRILAKNNKLIFTTIFMIGFLIMIFRLLNKYNNFNF